MIPCETAPALGLHSVDTPSGCRVLVCVVGVKLPTDRLFCEHGAINMEPATRVAYHEVPHTGLRWSMPLDEWTERRPQLEMAAGPYPQGTDA